MPLICNNSKGQKFSFRSGSIPATCSTSEFLAESVGVNSEGGEQVRTFTLATGKCQHMNNKAGKDSDGYEVGQNLLRVWCTPKIPICIDKSESFVENHFFITVVFGQACAHLD